MGSAEDAMLHRAVLLLEARHASEAESLIRQVLAQDPESAYVLGLLARALLDQGRADAAIIAARAGLVVEPHDHTLRQVLVHALCRSNQSDDAREIAASLVEDAPDLWSSHYALGVAWLGEPYPRTSLALESAERARALAPGSPDTLVLIGLCRSRLGDTRAARAANREALALEPGHAYALNNLAAGDIDRGRLHRGGRGLTSAMRVFPQSEIAQRNFGLLLSKMAVRLYLVALIGLFAVFLLAFQPWYVHASVAVVVVATLVLMTWRALRALPGGSRNWVPLLWRRAERTTRIRLRVGGLLVLAVLGLGLAPSFPPPRLGTSAVSSAPHDRPATANADQPHDDEPGVWLRIAPLGSLLFLAALRLVWVSPRRRRRGPEAPTEPARRPGGSDGMYT